jgi:hypothetical protein
MADEPEGDAKDRLRSEMARSLRAHPMRRGSRCRADSVAAGVPRFGRQATCAKADRPAQNRKASE